MSKKYEIRREEKCLDYAGGQLREPSKILSMDCHSMQGNQMWSYTVCLFILKINYFNINLSRLLLRIICYDMHQDIVLNYHQ